MDPVVIKIVSAIVGTVATKAASVATEELINLWGLEEDISNLKKKLQSIQRALEVADVEQAKNNCPDPWLSDMKDIAYDIDDVVDECATEAALRPQGLVEHADWGALSWWTGRACDSLCFVNDYFLSCCFPNPTRVSFRRQLTSRIKLLKKRLDGIEKAEFYLNLKKAQTRTTWARPETGPVLEKGWSPVGRDREMREIKKVLLAASIDNASPSGGIPSVIAIVGFGGLGKTTLAQAIFNDKEIQESFGIKKWLFVGENFEGKRLIKDILKNDGDKTQNLDENLGDLQLKLRAKLEDEEKGFLIILDDVWSTDWDPLWTPLTYGKKGSMIILTTRSRSVAQTKGCRLMRTLTGLSHEECWKIFKARTFPDGDSQGYPRQEELGQQIVKKLNGVPLAASMMGGFLRGFLHNTEKWESVLNSSMWPKTKEGDPVDSVIGLNYAHLPGHLRACFACCAMFPKDYVFNKCSLVQLWMALGYIQPQEDRRPEEYIGSEYFDDLYYASFFQYVDHEYVMHDLVHDFAQKVVKEEGHHMTTAGPVSQHVRHLSVSCGALSEWSEAVDLANLKKLRTFRLTCEGPASGLDVLLRQFKYVRVLVLSGYFIEELPDSIGDLRLLRYLDIQNTSIRILPRPLFNLRNLQTLTVSRDIHTVSSEEVMSKLANLRHLTGFFSDIEGIGKLNLHQQLKIYHVNNSRWLIEESHNRNHRGKLTISNLQKVEGRDLSELSSLTRKVHLEELVLGWKGFDSDGSLDALPHIHDSEVLQGLQLPPYLKWLTIQSNLGLQLPQQLPTTLESFQLIQCYFLEHLPPLSHLQFLEELRVEECPGIQCLPEGGLPSWLKRLTGCPRLVKHCRERGLDIESEVMRPWSVEKIEESVASAASILALVVCKVASPGFKELIELWGVEEGFRNISEKLQSLQAILENAMVVDPEYGLSGLVDIWLRRLKAEAQEIEDMLDDCAIFHLSDCLTLNSTQAPFHRDRIIDRSKSIKDRLDAIEKNEHYFSQSQPWAGGWKIIPLQENGRRRLLVGRDKEMKQIKEELLAFGDQCHHGQQSSSAPNVFVIAMVGEGGIGKTTIAQAIFEDEEVKANFSMRKWLLVGKDFDHYKLFMSIVDDGGSTQIRIGENLQVDLQKQLIDKLEGHRCLLVLDDVCSDGEGFYYSSSMERLTSAAEYWPRFWESLNSAVGSGTVIILTIRSVPLRKRLPIVNPLPFFLSKTTNIHEVGPLPDDECWKIFTGCAFPGGSSGEVPVSPRMLKGNPLLASMMGRLLGGNLHDQNNSESLRNSLIQWGEPLRVSDVVKLTYQHLPWHLKLCFDYCSIFPKNFVFDKSKMVQMWIAQDCIRPQEGRQLEDVGSDYFDDLHRISFLQCIEGKYVMPNLVHYFAESLVGPVHANLLGGREILPASADTPHLSVYCGTLAPHEVDWLRSYKRLRTLRLTCEGSPSNLDELLAGLKCIRVLELECYDIVELPSAVRHMKLLKYLDISKTSIKTMPELPNLRCLVWNTSSPPDSGSGSTTTSAILPPEA